jgi:hypothetical protein
LEANYAWLNKALWHCVMLILMSPRCYISVSSFNELLLRHVHDFGSEAPNTKEAIENKSNHCLHFTSNYHHASQEINPHSCFEPHRSPPSDVPSLEAVAPYPTASLGSTRASPKLTASRSSFSPSLHDVNILLPISRSGPRQRWADPRRLCRRAADYRRAMY